MANNLNLSKSKKVKNDEFYTRLCDIEKELHHYKEHFRDKVVYCNCDDPYESNFTVFFLMHFRQYGLKRLICTCYEGSPITNQWLSLYNFEDEAEKTTRHAYWIDVSHMDLDPYEVVDENAVREVLNKKKLVRRLQGNGDFHSEECIELLKQADILCTNPPFSKFRSYINLLIKYDKKFLIIGNQNAITYKEIFPLIKENRIWLGYNHVHTFIQKDGSVKKFGNIEWFSNLEHTKRHEPLLLYKPYDPTSHLKYDDFDAINICKLDDIPYDYDGVMGVPITFLDKYCPEQFEIIGVANHGSDNQYDLFKPKINGKEIFKRILIRKIEEN